MFDLPFDFLSLVIAIVAVVFARKAFNQVAVLRARLDLMEHLAASAPAAPVTAPVPPPLPREAPADQPAASETRSEPTRPPPPPIAPAAPPPNSARNSGPRPGTGSRLRGTPRHPLGGLGRRSDAGARRLLHGPLFDRGRADSDQACARCSAACSRWRCWPPANGPAARRASRRSQHCRSPTFRRSSPPPAPRSRSRRCTPPMRCTIFWRPPPPSSCSAWWRWARWPQRCCTARRWPDSASPRPSSRLFWSLPTSRTSGRCISISPSSPRRRSGWRESGCGAGWPSPPSCSRCCGLFLVCNAARRWSHRMRST